jgi:hypothetical protein
MDRFNGYTETYEAEVERFRALQGSGYDGPIPTTGCELKELVGGKAKVTKRLSPHIPKPCADAEQ